MKLDDISTTAEIRIPEKLIEQIIGQDAAVEKVKFAVKQKRNLLLVGPPGIGKSMLAKAMSDLLFKPMEEIVVMDNPQNPNKPIVKVLKIDEKEKTGDNSCEYGRTVKPTEVPTYVSEVLGFRCITCGGMSNSGERICPTCGEDKFKKIDQRSKPGLYNDLITEVIEAYPTEPEREVHATRINKNGEEEHLVYQRVNNEDIRVLDQKAINAIRDQRKKQKQVILVPFNRKTFVQATGASETELLGDVRHDPYGSHPEIGTPAYLRVVPGAVHEAHEGVLFVDELPQVGSLQIYILTAMQEKRFPIVGRNPQSAGASVKVENVPCDFLFVGACNIREVKDILPPLRSRIIGNGYEILLETTMPDTEDNRFKIAQFIAQEIRKDSRIPHASTAVVKVVIKEAKKMALTLDSARDSLTLRLRDLGGTIRMAGDYAVHDGSEIIEVKHIEKSIKESRSIEYQLKERYGSYWDALRRDDTVNLQSTEKDRSYL